MWYDEVKLTTDCNYVSSRVRLVRNIDGYHFPSKLEKTQSGKLLDKVFYGLKEIGTVNGEEYRFEKLLNMAEIDKLRLREMRIINSTSVNNKSLASGLILSKEEDSSVIVNGDDHIRLQIVKSGSNLQQLLERVFSLDDYINDKFPYAFDEKYGFLTSYPTNMGTGLKANIVVHLPLLSKSKEFANNISDLTRLGVTVKGVYGRIEENYGSLYDIGNSKTLGQSEEEIVKLVSKIATRLNNEEAHVRRMTLKSYRMERSDEAHKAYGILRYSRVLTLNEALKHLSTLMAGVSDGLIRLQHQDRLYRMYLHVMPSNVLYRSNRPLSKDELDTARADFVREHLPKIME